MLTKADQLKLKEFIVADEGYENFIYKDSLGNETVGIGHLCKNGFSNNVIDLIFQEDWQKHYNFLVKAFAWFLELNTARQFALISMSFNMGEANFMHFAGMISALKQKDFERAADEMLDSLWAKQVPNRVKKLSQVIRTGILK